MICAASVAELSKTLSLLTSEFTCALELTLRSLWRVHTLHFSSYLINQQSLSIRYIAAAYKYVHYLPKFSILFDLTSPSGYNSIPLLPFIGKLKRITSTHALQFLTSHSLTAVSSLVNVRSDLHFAKRNEDFTTLTLNSQ